MAEREQRISFRKAFSFLLLSLLSFLFLFFYQALSCLLRGMRSHEPSRNAHTRVPLKIF